jgi:hypothetical protein
LVSIADFEANGEGRVRSALARLGNHGGVGIDPNDPPLRPCPLAKTAHLMPKATAHIQNLIPLPNRTDIEHPPLDLLDQRVCVGAVQPAKDRPGVN